MLTEIDPFKRKREMERGERKGERENVPARY